MKVQNLRKLLSLAERPATGLNLPQISFNAEATQISKRICRNSGRGQLVCQCRCRLLHKPETASWRSLHSPPLGPATRALLLLPDDDLDLDVRVGRHGRSHALLLDEWALAVLLARQWPRGRSSAAPHCLFPRSTSLPSHQKSPT